MGIDKEHLSEIIKGNIENPSIEVDANGVLTVARGNYAKWFALGILVGMKSMHPESVVTVTDNIIADGQQ